MKKKWPIHILPMFLCLVMLFSIPAYAAETRASDRIVRSTVTLSKKSNGDLSIYFSVQANDIMEKIGATSVAIQRSSGNGWTTEYTFNTNVFAALYRAGVPRCGDDLCEGCNGDQYAAVVKLDNTNINLKIFFEFKVN